MEDYYYAWRKTGRNFLQQASRSPRGACHVLVLSLGAWRVLGARSRQQRGTGSRTELHALASSTDSKHPPALLLSIEASWLCFYCQ